ncbi:hypothetical protein FOWG_18196 [Fusarium oxysporum f. sp. lycopersici MN25]|nr:hypothetical protein FOWG_18196 [Fusarium oxysporum f. sp. lycopersici MN25]
MARRSTIWAIRSPWTAFSRRRRRSCGKPRAGWTSLWADNGVRSAKRYGYGTSPIAWYSRAQGGHLRRTGGMHG